MLARYVIKSKGRYFFVFCFIMPGNKANRNNWALLLDAKSSFVGVNKQQQQ